MSNKKTSVQDGIYALRKAHMRFTPSLSSFPNVTFETVPDFVWLMMALSHLFKEDCLALPLSTPLSSRPDQKRRKETRDIFMAGICCWEAGGGSMGWGRRGVGSLKTIWSLTLATLRIWCVWRLHLWYWLHWEFGVFEDCISDIGYTENLVCLKTASLILATLRIWCVWRLHLWYWLHWEFGVFEDYLISDIAYIKVYVCLLH